MSTGVQGQSSTQSTAKASSNQGPPPLSPYSQVSGQGRSLGMSNSPNTREGGIQGLNTDPIVASNTNLVPKSLLPSFAPRQLNQLPTPQSPNNFGQYVLDVPYTPESPVPNGSQTSYAALAPTSVGQRLAVQRQSHTMEDARVISQPRSQQTITPESSPYLRSTPRYTTPATPQHHSKSHSSDMATSGAPTSPTSIKLESSTSASTLAPAHRISSPVSFSDHRSSRLSSPFMAKLSIADKSAKSRTPGHSRPQSYTPELRPTRDDVFSPTPATRSGISRHTLERPSSISTPPISPPPLQSDGQIRGHVVGGEIERIRQEMMQDRLTHVQEAESRRPDYLKRAKRTLSEADPTAHADEEVLREQERAAAVGITESPNKGRRLKLFQETSEESFEESLMAGGYGRYRTAEWVRQPQPLTLITPGPAGPSNVITTLEEAEEVPPTEKELKKRKRLAAFRGERTPYDEPSTKLYPVELEGRGRVLLDVPAEEPGSVIDPEPTPSKKKSSTRRKRKGAEPTAKEKKALAMAAAAAENLVHKPNWPDAEFPWKLRTEERADWAKAEKEEKMKWIERFLDRDSDDEDDEEGLPKRDIDQDMSPPSHWGSVYDNETDQPPRGGRGKMVPLLTNPGLTRPQLKRKSSYFPSDPSDARAALLSKKSVRTLSYRQQRRLRQMEDDSDDEIVCICRGRDDGRELVQCDGCETWYHLECIGIRNIAELGKEEDPWFCRICETDDIPSRLPQMDTISNEPIFVPTDEEPRRSLSFDPPFFQPSIQDSPMTWNPVRMPKTPTRGGRNSEYDHGLSSSAPWIDSTRNGPSTPQHHAYDDDPLFDPTSTPSRGIRFGVPFATPKNNVWSARPNGSFHTPSKGSNRATGGKTFGGPGTLSNALDDGAGESGGTLSSSPFSRMHPYDESPIRRAISGEGPKGRNIMDSPLASRSRVPLQQLEDSPIMRYREQERFHQSGRKSFDESTRYDPHSLLLEFTHFLAQSPECVYCFWLHEIIKAC
ncbi:hypothetical protein BDZ94DRAFT_1230581 [Collybia nuda]|uniref:PHD-type domain-containing protein n=1 Tax=Collybia nuda TaxID=64659 RepID=A0A9P5XRZ8_9AGAR|nr:hypothetical protein BDZ94DRAFT_1230581 [Collybia nuda]